MITVGAVEAKTILSALLERVAEGEEVLITKHGRAVARIIPAVGVDRARARKAIAAIRREAKGRRLRGLSMRRMMGDVLPLGRDTGLAACDAMYLDLAIRHDLPLATLDRSLRSAARKSRLTLLPS